MSKQRWFLPTHTENLEIFLSGGLITCGSGVSGSPVRDVMTDYPVGYIPFFSKDNLFPAIEKSREEDENLVRCIIELDVSQILQLTVFAQVVSTNESIRRLDYIELKIEDVRELAERNTIVLPAPLPLQCIKSVIFENIAIKNDVYKLIDLDLGAFSEKLFSVDARLFEEDKKSAVLPEIGDSCEDHQEKVSLPEREVDYAKVTSLGGLLALMFYQSKNGDASIQCFAKACELRLLSDHSSTDFEILNNYFYCANGAFDNRGQSYFDLLGILSKSSGSVSEVKWEILNYLESSNDLSESLKIYSSKMARRLRDIEERLIDKTPEEVFTLLMSSYADKPANSKILMVLSMYFFRDKIETMLKFYHKDFDEIDYVLFAMFFGVGCRYIGLPSHIKRIRGLGVYISNRMAEYAQLLSGGSAPAFKSYPAPKCLLGNMIRKTSDGSSDRFIDWISGHLKLDSSEFQTWEVRHTGFSCESNSPLTFRERPKLTSLIDIAEFGRQLVISSIGNDKDLFDYNMAYDQYAKLVK